ncbi:TPA: LysR family transcriptional regulator, partial [Acinetobacter baumannii]
LGGLCRTSSFTLPPFDQKCEFACDKETGHEYTIRTLVEQHNIAEAYTLKT